VHAAELIRRLDPPPPPIFEDGDPVVDHADGAEPGFWLGLGWPDGRTCWRALIAASSEDGAREPCDCEGKGCADCDGAGWTWRREPVVSYHDWDAVLRAEQRRRARYLLRLYRQREQLLVADAAACGRVELHWLDHYGVVQDPHFRDPGLLDLPLVTFPDQRALYLWMHRLLDGEEARSLITNKGRSRGWSWTLLNLATEHLLLRPGFLVEVNSRKMDDVDRGAGDTKALLGKVRYILERLPAHLSPDVQASEVQQRDGEGLRTIQSLIVNRWTGGRISGSATTADSGRGDRVRLKLWDEFARIDPHIQEQARGAAETVAHVDLVGSTPSEPGTRFHYEWQHAQDDSKLFMPWYGDPRRAARWWRERLIEEGGHLTRSERDREHGGVFLHLESIQIWRPTEAVAYLDEALPVEWRRRSKAIAAMDFGTGPSATTFLLGLPEWDRVEVDGKARYRLARLWLDWSTEWHRTREAEIAREVDERWGADYSGSLAVYGDHAGIATGAGQRSVIGELAAAGLHVIPAPVHYMSQEHKDHVIRVVQDWLDAGILRIHGERAQPVLRAVESWEWQVPRGLRIAEVSREHIKPRKDSHSHHGDALIILASCLLDGIGRPRVPVKEDRRAPRPGGSSLSRLLG
jgi:hypothetical protein